MLFCHIGSEKTSSSRMCFFERPYVEWDIDAAATGSDLYHGYHCQHTQFLITTVSKSVQSLQKKIFI